MTAPTEEAIKEQREIRRLASRYRELRQGKTKREEKNR